MADNDDVTTLEMEPATLQWPAYSCVRHYRECISLRRVLLRAYTEDREFSYVQFLSFLFLVEVAEDDLARLGEDLISKDLWRASGHLRLKEGRRPKSGASLVLTLDALLLIFCPNPFLHLLRDALELRLATHEPPGKTTYERWTHFHNAIKWAEVTCRRVWLDLWEKEPKKPPRDWWLKVARRMSVTGLPR